MSNVVSKVTLTRSIVIKNGAKISNNKLGVRSRSGVIVLEYRPIIFVKCNHATSKFVKMTWTRHLANL